ncbi:short-chain dehydrogenase [Pseudomonas jessenii]|uniref:Short-chain dehydrogenase n=1 Tax=Pseudomonas jessenii TaxID=77298 RepID=A0A2W0F885_PSEJE|nr:SDR family NAD(P)-dependent oxidoreductase [Pseudomonas jessenii]PYY72511.1 short-chain dehydrogenase [Pseudomonas jessenii]
MKMKTLIDKTAIVIGGETGIGRATAIAFASAGAKVTVAGIFDDKGEETIRAIRAAGGFANFVHLDVRDSGCVKDLVQRGSAINGAHDILVYCAGAFDNMVGCSETSEELWDQVMDINLKGCFLANKAALETIPRGWGRIINIGSVASFNSSADGFPYTVSKHAMIGLTKHIARRYGGSGVTANCVCPGIIETDIVANTKRIIGEQVPPINKETFTAGGWEKWVPVGRQGRVDEVADLILYLASGNTGYITGHAHVIDGRWLTA